LHIFFFFTKIWVEMRSVFLLLLFLFLHGFIFPAEAGKTAGKSDPREKLLVEILDFTPRQNTEILKNKIRQLCRSSNTPDRSVDTAGFLKKMLKKKKYGPVHYYIYLQLARFSPENEKKLLKKALEHAGNEREKLESLIKLYEYHRGKRDVGREILYLEKQVEIREKSGDPAALKNLYLTLGDYHLRENNLLKSLRSFLEARKYSHGDSNSNSGYFSNRAARVFLLLGRHKLALKYIRESLEFAEKYNNDHLKMWDFNILTEIYMAEGETIRADQYNQESIRMGEREVYPDLLLQSYFLRAKLFLNNGQEITGLAILKKAVDYGILNESHEHLMPVLYEFTRRAIRYGNLEIASRYLNEMKDIYAPYYREFFLCYFIEGILNEKAGNLEAAGKFFEKTRKNLDRFFSELNHLRHYPYREEITFIYSRIAQYNFRMFNKTDDLRYLRRAFYAAEVKNPYMFRRLSDSSRRLVPLIKEKERINTEVSRINKLLLTGKYSEKGLAALNRRRDALKTELIELEDLILEFPKRYARFRDSDLNLREIHRILDPETLVVRFILLEENAYAFVIDHKNAGYRKLDMGSPQISKLVNTLLAPIRAYREGEVDFLRVYYDMGLAEKLYKILLFDVLAFHKDKKKLIIIPDKELFEIPFEALITRHGGSGWRQDIYFSEYEDAGFLIDQYSIEYLLSVFHLKQMKRETRKKYDISAFGFPVFRQDRNKDRRVTDSEYTGFTLLPSSRDEIGRIRAIWGKRKSRFFTGSSFTKENFNRTAVHSRIVHLATHFVSNRKYPWHSMFLFSPGNNNDPYCYIFDISKLKLNCDLVFLSTCGSLEGHLMGAQLISGITATLYNSGAGSMIASLWPVNEFSSRIIPPFYTEVRNRWGRTLHFASLLRDVKKRFRKRREAISNGKKISFSHPLIWANFNLYRFFLKN